jgi:hypothetical protein
MTDYKNIFNQLTTITTPYIDEKNIWNSFFSNVKLSQFYPLVSSNKQTDVRILNLRKLKKIGDFYEYKMTKIVDCYKNFKISLLPSDDQEYVTDICLYMNKNKVCELTKINENTFSLPNYIFGSNYDLVLKFKIVNDRMTDSITRFINVEEIYLHSSKRQLLTEKVKKIILQNKEIDG